MFVRNKNYRRICRMNKFWIQVMGCLAALTIFSFPLAAATVTVPNASYESPTTVFVSTLVDSWQKNPRPAWYQETGTYQWDQLIGLFKNTATNAADHIFNMHGNQAAWLFAVPEVGMFQDYNSVDHNDGVPSHAFASRFEVGKAYRLTVGVLGAGGNMLEGVPLELALYYRDATSNQVVVARTIVTNSAAAFPDRNHLVDYSVNVPTVTLNDAWAGQHIGIRMVSTVSLEMQGGYWDVDNVRLTTAGDLRLTNPTVVDGQFQLTISGETGARYEMFASANITLPFNEWTSLGIITNATGGAMFATPATNLNQHFFRAVQLP
jgi:hypothetical protein